MKKINGIVLLLLLLTLCACSESIDPPESVAMAPSLSAMEAPPSNNLAIYEAQPYRFHTETLCNLLLGNDYKTDATIPPADGVAYYTNGAHLFVHSKGDSGGGNRGTHSLPSETIYHRNDWARKAPST